MRVEVVRSGGFAGIPLRGALETSGHRDAARLESLARAVADAAPAAPRPVVPDGFVYDITVDGRTIRCADPHLTCAQRELITSVLQTGA